MRERVCRLQLLLVLDNVVILGSEFCGTRDHILLSQIRGFPFRGLLRLAGLRRRYSNPPTHGKDAPKNLVSLISRRHGPRIKFSSSIVAPIIFIGTCLFAKASPSNGSVYLLIKNMLPSSECCFVVSISLPSNGSTRYNILISLHGAVIKWAIEERHLSTCTSHVTISQKPQRGFASG
jgi:hypothetical protein